MALEPRQLNDADRDILDFMRKESDRVNPSYVAEESGHSRPYVSQRLKRLKEHDHVRQPHRGLWELVNDPRDDVDDRVHVLLVRTNDPTTLEEAENAMGLELGPAVEDVESDIVEMSKDDLVELIVDE